MLSLQDITPDQVTRAYSGKAFKCCCGCAGKYYCTTGRLWAEREAERSASANNGMVSKILRLVKENHAYPDVSHDAP